MARQFIAASSQWIGGFGGDATFYGGAALTLSMWYMGGASGNGDGLVGQRYDNWALRGGVLAANGMLFQTGSFGTTYGYSAINSFAVSTWLHVGVRFDGAGSTNADKLKIYNNMSSLPLTFVGTLASTLFTNSQPFRIGTLDGATAFGNFSCAYIKIWNTLLTEGQLAREANLRRPIQSGCRIWIPCDERTVCNDYSGKLTPRVGELTFAGSVVQGPPGVSYGGRRT